MSEIILKPSKNIDFDINTLNKIAMSNESIDYNLYMNNAYSIEAIKMTKDEFEQVWPQLKEKLGVFFDDFKSKFEVKYKQALQKERPKLEKKIAKLGNSDLNIESLMNELENKVLIWNTKEKFIKEFREDVLDQVPSTRKEICSMLIIDLDKSLVLDNTKQIKAAAFSHLAGLISYLFGFILAEMGNMVGAVVSVLAGLAANIGGAVLNHFGNKSENIHNKISRSSDKEYKNKKNEISKLNGKNFFRVVNYTDSEGEGAGRKFKMIYGLDPQFKIKGVYMD